MAGSALKICSWIGKKRYTFKITDSSENIAIWEKLDYNNCRKIGNNNRINKG